MSESGSAAESDCDCGLTESEALGSTVTAPGSSGPGYCRSHTASHRSALDHGHRRGGPVGPTARGTRDPARSHGPAAAAASGSRVRVKSTAYPRRGITYLELS